MTTPKTMIIIDSEPKEEEALRAKLIPNVSTLLTT